jgi:hypothetical protein
VLTLSGYGHNALAPNSPTPPRNATGHAWSAVLLDDNKWKLLDACWGAGNVNNEVFNKDFNPSMFTMSNESFGLRHFPEDPSQQYRYEEGQRQISWEEYIRGESTDQVQVFGSWEEHGFSRESLQPNIKDISTRGGDYVRFQFTKVCSHFSWTAIGEKPFLTLMVIKGRGGNGGLLETWRAMDSDGYTFWIDIPRDELGVPGQTIMLYELTKLNDVDAKGISKKEYEAQLKTGRVGVCGSGLAVWNLT